VHVYIDEAGVFVVPEKRERYVCCHVALLIPSSQAELVLYEFLRLRDLWGRTQIELKGSSLDEAQIAAVVELLLKFDVIVRVVAIDMAEHTEAAVTQFKEAQAAAVTKNLTLEHKPGLVKQMEELRDRWRALPNQLFVQSLTAIILVKDAIQTGTLYYCQRLPQELAEFRWVIDAKDRKITDFEKLWTTVILPVLESQSVTTPLVFSTGADYSHFRRFFYDEATADPEARQHVEWLRQLVGPRETFNGVDLRKLLEEHRAFANSQNNLGVQLVDVIGSAFFRALNGTLAQKAWARLGALLVKEAPATIHFIALSAAGRPAGVTAVEHPSAEIVRQIEAQARSMWP